MKIVVLKYPPHIIYDYTSIGLGTLPICLHGQQHQKVTPTLMVSDEYYEEIKQFVERIIEDSPGEPLPEGGIH